ncbi:MAG: hypothetical protein LQ351_005513 [Letrouitia transgressa]|nr:MAG: hypothetical protein LQ351_005513 [Letrouitia transgressa]
MTFRFIRTLTVLLISSIQATPAKKVSPSSPECPRNLPTITVTSTLFATSTIPTFPGFTPILSTKTNLNARAELKQALSPDEPDSFKVWVLNPTALTAATLPPLETCSAISKPPTATATTASFLDAACASDNLVSCVRGSEYPVTGFEWALRANSPGGKQELKVRSCKVVRAWEADDRELGSVVAPDMVPRGNRRVLS